MIDFKRPIIFSGIIIAFVAVFLGGAIYGKLSIVCETCAPTDVNFSSFWDAYKLLKGKFVDPTKVTDENVLYGAISGMAQNLGDPYTVFFDPEAAESFENELAGYFDGIGIEIGIKQGQLTVVSPLEGTPAQVAGLRAGDIILKIDEKDAAGITSDEAVSLIRGKKGTDVTLSIFRSGWAEAKDFKITRDTIKIPSLRLIKLDNGIAQLKIYQFSQVLSSDFNKTAFEIADDPSIKKIIIDLRNNPGGYLEVSQHIAGWFLASGQTVVIEDFGQGKAQQTYKAEGNAMFANYPVVVLMNQGSASASEILAGALRDNREIKLVGETSFGKGSVQEGVNMRDGSFLKITVAKWLTPNGTSISEKGLDPDVEVELTEEDLTDKKDPQLDKAIEILNAIQ